MKKLYKSLVLKALPKSPSQAQSQTGQTTAERSHKDDFHLVFEGDAPSLDIIALHGQGGNWKTSWTDHVTGCFWLGDLLPDVVPNARVLSYGYGASRSSIVVVEDFLAELVQLRKLTGTEQRPIIFLAHSFGGFLIKSILTKSHEMKDKSNVSLVFSSTHGILFFGVPQKAEKSFDNLASASAEEGSDSPEIQVLKRDFRWMQESNIAYSHICGRFVTKYFVESADSVSRLAPKDDDERPGLAEAGVVLLSKTHGQTIRYPNADDVDFQKVSEVLTAIVAEVARRGNQYRS